MTTSLWASGLSAFFLSADRETAVVRALIGGIAGWALSVYSYSKYCFEGWREFKVGLRKNQDLPGRLEYLPVASAEILPYESVEVL